MRYRHPFARVIFLVGVVLGACCDSPPSRSPGEGAGGITGGDGGADQGGGNTQAGTGGTLSGGTGGTASGGTGGTASGGTGGTASGGTGGAVPIPTAKCRVATGRYHTVVLKDNGTVWHWGRYTGATTPIQITALGNDNVQVEGGSDDKSCALKKDGSIWCWGNQTAGSPSKAFTGPAVQFALGILSGQICAIKPDSTLWCWGKNDYGQVGHGNITTGSAQLPPGQVLDNVAQVTAGLNYTCALKKDGTAWCWGENGSGGWLGVGKTTPYEQRPVHVADLGNDVVQISAENQGTCALKKDTTVWCWWGSPDERDAGSNGGPLGVNIGVNSTRLPASPPVQVAGGITDVAQISVGRRVVSALKKDGTLWTWGPTALGRTTASGPIPLQVTALGNKVTQVSNRYRHACARTNDGDLWCWGMGSEVYIGNGTGGSVLPAKVSTTCGP